MTKSFLIGLTLLISSGFSVRARAELYGAPLLEGDGALVQGVVTSVCQKKGCWMTVKTDSGERFVRFKDYGFFMPKDLTGKKIKMKAIDKEVEVSENDRKHFLKDAGAPKSEISKVKGSSTRMEWLASGVEVVE